MKDDIAYAFTVDGTIKILMRQKAAFRLAGAVRGLMNIADPLWSEFPPEHPFRKAETEVLRALEEWDAANRNANTEGA